MSAAAHAQSLPPRYTLIPVQGSVHPCSSGNAPWRGAFITDAGAVAGDSYCGQVTYGSEAYLWAAGSVTEFARGDFDYTSPMGVLPAWSGGGSGAPAMLVSADLCPPQSGPCSSAIAIARVGEPPVILGFTNGTAVQMNDRSESGWVVGWGAIGGSTAWRVSPSGSLAPLDAPTGWGEWVVGVGESGDAVGGAYISNLQRGVVWRTDGSTDVLGSVEPNTASRAADIAIDGSVVGQANGRAVWWPAGSTATGAPALELLPIGSQSEATHVAGNPSSAGPLGWAVFGTTAYGAKLFRSNGGTWSELALPAGINALGVEWIGAANPTLAIAMAHDQFYQPIALVWTAQGGVERLQSRVVSLGGPAAPADLVPIDINASGTILLSDGFQGAPFIAVPLAAGDANGDGAVNGADLSALLSAWGPVTTGASPHAADFDASGVIDASDLTILLGAWE